MKLSQLLPTYWSISIETSNIKADRSILPLRMLFKIMFGVGSIMFLSLQFTPEHFMVNKDFECENCKLAVLQLGTKLFKKFVSQILSSKTLLELFKTIKKRGRSIRRKREENTSSSSELSVHIHKRCLLLKAYKLTKDPQVLWKLIL